MKLTVFASGSTGNCCLVQGGGRRLLVDAGISARRITAALAGQGLTPDQLDGILITHEHSDHIQGLANLLKKTPVTVFAPGTVAVSLRLLVPGVEPYLRVIEPERDLILGHLSVIPFPTSHDTAQSVGYRLSADDGRAVVIAI